MNNFGKNFALWIIIALLLVALFNLFQGGANQGQQAQMAFSDFLADVRQGEIAEVTIQGNTISGRTSDGRQFQTYAPDNADIVPRLEDTGVRITAKPAEESMHPLLSVLISWFPMLLLIGVWIFFMRQMQSGGGKAMGFGKSRARLLTEKSGRITFEDVAGVEEAKQEVQEVVEFLRDPQKFQRLGGKIPKGVLLVGPPGTGKTLLARAIAGEANVPFFTISGSDFVEMFVGVGASRVRDMFEQGKKNSPCIIFIDEIDAVGRHRGAGLGGGNDEREQILKVHTRKVPLAPDVDHRVIARGTPGFSGADLANLVNEAALLAARKNKRMVTMTEMEEAKDKVMMGAERRSMVMTEEEKKLTAYHEGGHALVMLKIAGHDPLHKVTIIPRGRALGMTMFLPERDKYSHKRMEIEALIASLFGGRVAEEMIFGPESVTTGASDDIRKATSLARSMVTEWGMSEKLGPLRYEDNDEEVFLGHSVTQHKNVSDATARTIDEEVKRLVQLGEAKAREIITDNIDDLHTIANGLLEYETLSNADIQALLRGEDIQRPEPGGPSDQGGGIRSSVPTSGPKPQGGKPAGGPEPEPQPG